MKTVTTYTAAELKQAFPNAYEKALKRYQDNITDIPWADETMDSLKALFDHTTGIRLQNWEIGAYSYSWIKADFDQDEAADLTGARAVAWLENNLYASLRIKTNHGKFTGKDASYYLQNLKYNQSYRSCGNDVRPYTIGMIPPCPFTGYCADDDYIESLNKSIKHGDTLREAFEGLADVARHLLELELDQETSEEGFLDAAECNEWQYTESGHQVY